jgi:hypothetical protein
MNTSFFSLCVCYGGGWELARLKLKRQISCADSTHVFLQYKPAYFNLFVTRSIYFQTLRAINTKLDKETKRTAVITN